ASYDALYLLFNRISALIIREQILFLPAAMKMQNQVAFWMNPDVANPINTTLGNLNNTLFRWPCSGGVFRDTVDFLYIACRTTRKRKRHHKWINKLFTHTNNQTHLQNINAL
ncbi:hypothetical protein, partial [Cronobacter sakazakii]|uniref:hypothetical protein n=1 Tax=Cronobacter sakazakii TaxID=28141 RepID=UPI000D51EAF8